MTSAIPALFAADHSPVIRSLLETDLYKFTMLQTMLHRMSDNTAIYRFVCRSKTAIPLGLLAKDVSRELDHLCTLRFDEEELQFLAGLRYLKRDFIEFLRIFHLQRNRIRVWADENQELHIEAEGPQLHVMLFEIYVLAIVSELYNRKVHAGNQAALAEQGWAKLQENIALVKAYDAKQPGLFQLSDFGVRRRLSGAWHETVVQELKRQIPKNFVATSNVYLAMKYGLTPVGTMAHEYLQSFQAMGNVQLARSQAAALEAWVQEYRGDLGIALTDVIGMDAFLADFDLYFAKLFDGLRHDSGDPVVWGEKAIAHYKKLRIDPGSKRLVFSDGLTFQKALDLCGHFKGRIQTAFGIGTKLTCDVGVPALNIVMKVVKVNGEPVAKISDSPGKTLCDDTVFLAYLRKVFNVPAES